MDIHLFFPIYTYSHRIYEYYKSLILISYIFLNYNYKNTKTKNQKLDESFLSTQFWRRCANRLTTMSVYYNYFFFLILKLKYLTN